MLRIYDALPSYMGEISKRFKKEFCEGNMLDAEYAEFNNICVRLTEMAENCKKRKQGKNDDKTSD